ncbi:hypothetical protein AMTR_s00016p00254730 [Amborella trichopoda]|uniref:Uncharacterized protein n=3 Tax=Amborella trichopoda TaxID=13333 RepID=W1PFB2_AMBTC|nr:hypothetical protein AMTR_s00016p00254730 [Amborella trichopoda]
MGGTGREQSQTHWMLDLMNGKLSINREKEAEEWKRRCIYKVPGFLKELHKEAFIPRVVSLGPFHHGSPHLQPMEQHKRRALLHFLDRSEHPLQVYLSALQAKEQAIRGCYEWPNDLAPPNSPELLDMMLLDGCFLLELHRVSQTDGETGYAAEDPVFGSKSSLFFAHHNSYHDLLILENQIPLMVLNTLLDPLGTRICTRVNELMLELLGEEIEGEVLKGKMGLHTLQVYMMHNLCGDVPDVEELSDPEPYFKKLPSATELHEAGVRFEISSKSGLMNITFEHGVLRLPWIAIHGSTETFLLNMMAFEQLRVRNSNWVSSYVSLLDDVIDTANDVELLVSSGIVENAMGSNEDVADIFNRITKGMVFFENPHLMGVRTRLMRYCKKRRNRWRAYFIHTYLSDPWTLISLLAAALLLILTLLQTHYTVLGYYK